MTLTDTHRKSADNPLRLHRLAMAVSTNASPALLVEYFDLAGDLDGQVR
jgi:hypothetical protein